MTSDHTPPTGSHNMDSDEPPWGPPMTRHHTRPTRNHSVDVSDPTYFIRTLWHAMDAAAAAMRDTAVARPEVALRDPNGFWRAYTEIPLAALLYAASPAESGSGIGWAAAALDNTDPERWDEPGWCQVAAYCRDHVVLAEVVMRVMIFNDDDQQRDSILLLLHDVIDHLASRPAAPTWLDSAWLDTYGYANPQPTAHHNPF